MKILNSISWALLVFIYLGALSAAIGEQPISASPHDSLIFRIPAEPITLDWNLAFTSNETPIIMNLMEGLIQLDEHLAPQPGLAEKWEISSDGETFTFFLRPGVQWSDGKLLKAQDFVDSWLRLLSPSTHSEYANYLFDIIGAEDFHSGKIKNTSAVGIKALSDSKFQVKLKRVVPYFLQIPTFWVTFPIRKDLISRFGKAWTDPKNLVTLGPFKLAEWNHEESLKLVRNPNYYLGSHVPPQATHEVVAWIQKDDRAAREAFQKGRLDILLDATTQDLIWAKGEPQNQNLKVARFPYLATYYLGFNLRSTPMKQVDLRKAIAIAIASARSSLPALLQGGQVVAKGWIPPGMLGFQENVGLSENVFEARQALAKAGFSDSRNPPPLEFHLENSDGAQSVAQFIVITLREKLGLEVHVKIDSPKEYQSAVQSGKAALFFSHWGADYADPANFFEVFDSHSGTNRTALKSSEYDRLIGQARDTLDLPTRLQLYAKAEKILLESEVAILPLFYRPLTTLVRNSISGFYIHPMNYIFFKNVVKKP